jgi:hypothetical protein
VFLLGLAWIYDGCAWVGVCGCLVFDDCEDPLLDLEDMLLGLYFADSSLFLLSISELLSMGGSLQ